MSLITDAQIIERILGATWEATWAGAIQSFGRFITLTPLRKIGAGPFLTVAAFSISALAQAKIDAAQEAFRGQVTAMAASDSIDFAMITAKLKSQERNATAQSNEKLLAEAKPADAAWQNSVSSALSVGGIAIAKDSTEHKADWPSIAWQIIAYLVLGAAFIYVVVSQFYKPKDYL